MEDKRGKEFERIANPDKNGVSSNIQVTCLPDNLKVTNGCNYTRKGSYLDDKYFIEKNYEKGSINTKTEAQMNGVGKGKLKSIKLVGLKKEGKKEWQLMF